jgi:hypothetical protein
MIHLFVFFYKKNDNIRLNQMKQTKFIEIKKYLFVFLIFSFIPHKKNNKTFFMINSKQIIKTNDDFYNNKNRRSCVFL